MNRVDFMKQLESLLQNISPAEREEALQYYNEYFNDAGEENEQDVIEALGNPAKVAENIKRDLENKKNNDNNILALLSSQNSGLFLPYFRSGLQKLLVGEERIGASSKRMDVPEDYWNNHVVSVFVETVLWWIDNGLQQSPETIADYYMRVV